jgi:hypothetical protein
VTDFLWLDVGRREVTYFVTWLPDCYKWGFGGLVCPHPDISETYYFFGDYFGMALQHGISCPAMGKLCAITGGSKKVIRKKLNFFAITGVRLLDYPRFVTSVTIDNCSVTWC